MYFLLSRYKLANIVISFSLIIRNIYIYTIQPIPFVLKLKGQNLPSYSLNTATTKKSVLIFFYSLFSC